MTVAPAVTPARPSPDARHTLEAHALRRRLGGRWVVDGVNLSMAPGEIVGLLGPNGAGKTVTFYMISGLLRPTSGVIMLDGIDITGMAMHERSRLGLAYLSQERSVFRGLTARENVAAILECHGLGHREVRARTAELLERFDLGHVAGQRADRLSGGEQRRLEVARTVAARPRFVLFDEPFAGIDPITIEMLHRLIVDLRRSGIGILLTDHNVTEALTLCDRAYILFNGRVIAEGTSSELATNIAVREHFLGTTFALPAASDGAFPDAMQDNYGSAPNDGVSPSQWKYVAPASKSRT